MKKLVVVLLMATIFTGLFANVSGGPASSERRSGKIIWNNQ